VKTEFAGLHAAARAPFSVGLSFPNLRLARASSLSLVSGRIRPGLGMAPALLACRIGRGAKHAVNWPWKTHVAIISVAAEAALCACAREEAADLRLPVGVHVRPDDGRSELIRLGDHCIVGHDDPLAI
jgi:hypothetical protein